MPDFADLRPFDCLVNGSAMRVLLSSGEVCDEIAPRLAPVIEATDQTPLHTFAVLSGSDRVFVFRDGVCIGCEGTTPGARAILLQAMVGVDAPASILHAGGCGGVLIAGESGSGKTTLCAALMARGLGYHCDDSAVLDHEFRVAPVPFAFMLRQGSWQVLEERLPALKSAPVHHRWGTDVRFLPPTPLDGPTKVNALVFVHYQAAGRTKVEELTIFESLLELQRSGFWLEHAPERIERFLAWLGTIGRYRLQYGQLEEAEEFVDGLASENRAKSSAQSLVPRTTAQGNDGGDFEYRLGPA
jgi:hypothetical protein